jgi:hypothetical protein
MQLKSLTSSPLSSFEPNINVFKISPHPSPRPSPPLKFPLPSVEPNRPLKKDD